MNDRENPASPEQPNNRFSFGNWFAKDGIDSSLWMPAFSAFLLLRLLGQQEKETQAIAEFENTTFVPGLPDSARWEQITAKALSGADLSAYLREEVWPNLLSSNSYNGLPRLAATAADLEPLSSKQLLALVNSLSKLSIQAATEYYQLLAGMFTEYCAKREFTTPDLAVQLMVAVADPKPGESVYDPCCGCGDLLLAAAKRTKSQPQSGAFSSPTVQTKVSGLDIEAQLALFSAVRLLLAGVPSPLVACADALELPRTQAGGGRQYDCILADIPFGLQIERSISSHFRVPSRSAEVLFLQHIIDSLKPGGRAVVLVPDSILFRKGPEARFRQWLLSEARVDAVIPLPPDPLKKAQMRCSLLVISKQPPREDIFFVGLAQLWPATEPFRKVRMTVTSKPDGGADYGPLEFHPRPDDLLESGFDLLTFLVRLRQGTVPSVLEARRVLQRLTPRDPAPEPADSSQQASNEYFSGLIGLAEHLLDPAHKLLPSAWKYSLVPIRRLAERNWELLEKEAGLDQLDTFLKQITEALPDTRIVPLSECAEVFTGNAYRRKDTEEDFHFLLADEPIPEVKLVRVQDLMKTDDDSEGVNFLLSTSRRLLAQETPNIPEKQFLRPGDLLVSTGGTVGKVVLTREDVERTVATDGVAVIRCKDPLLAHFIAYLLLTDPYQEWLASHASGRFIRNLRVTVLRGLPIPLAPRRAQLAVARSGRARHNEQSFLDLLSQRGASPWLNFLIESPHVRAMLNRPRGEELPPETLIQHLKPLIDDLVPLSARAEADQATDTVAAWLVDWTPLVCALFDTLLMPPGLSRFTMLQAWLTRFLSPESGHVRAAQTIEAKLRSDLTPPILKPGFQAIQLLNTTLAALARSECARMLAADKVAANLSPSIIPIGRDSEITIVLTNSSVLPLARIRALVSCSAEILPPIAPSAEIHEAENRIRAFASSAQEDLLADVIVPHLAPDETFAFPFKVSPTSSGPLQVRIICRASRVDLSTVQFFIPLALEVRTLREAARTPKLDKSPYVVGSPIDPRSNMFYGREDIIDQIKRALRTEGSSTVILLEGNRRVGKSSLLKRLAALGLGPEWMTAYVNFQSFDGSAGKPGMATREIFYGIAKELTVAAARLAPSFRLPGVTEPVPLEEGMKQTAFQIRHLRPAFANDNPFECFRFIIEAILEAIGSRRVLLMLDEFDKIQEGIDSGLTSPQLPENLRNLFHTYHRVSGILTGSRTIRRLRQEYWNVLFGLGISIPITGLDPGSARRLVTEPVQGQLVYSPAAADYVVSHCARQPFLIQGVCHSVFELCAASKEESVSVELATRAAQRYAQDNEHFRTVWDQVGTHRRRYLVCLLDQLSQSQGGQAPVTLELLRNELEKKGIAYRAVKQLVEDLEELVALEVLGTHGDQRQRAYRIEIPILSDWLRRNVDSEAHRLEALNEIE